MRPISIPRLAILQRDVERAFQTQPLRNEILLKESARWWRAAVRAIFHPEAYPTVWNLTCLVL